MENSILVQSFIEQIWNKRAFDTIDLFLHPNFKDHSLLPTLPPTKEGLKKWILATGLAFDHNTVIEDMVAENQQIMVRVKMKLKHIGVWRGIEPTGMELFTIGYRHFKIIDNKIVEHWALIDGEYIENQLKEASRGCKINP